MTRKLHASICAGLFVVAVGCDAREPEAPVITASPAGPRIAPPGEVTWDREVVSAAPEAPPSIASDPVDAGPPGTASSRPSTSGWTRADGDAGYPCGALGDGGSDCGASDGRLVSSAYIGRLIAFFRRGFVASGLGIPSEEAKKLSASVTVTIAGDGTVTGFSIGPSGNAAFDRAVHDHLKSKVGSTIPPPPEDRPDLMKSSLSMIFTCGSGCTP